MTAFDRMLIDDNVDINVQAQRIPEAVCIFGAIFIGPNSIHH